MTRASPPAYARPPSLAAAFELLAEYGESARPLAGGTDLVVGLHSGRFRPRLVVDLKRIADLPRGITEVAGRLRVAAPTPLADLIADPRMARHFPALVAAAQTVGSVQIRNRATLTGNICNASPAADTAPALLAHDAEVVLVGPAGERRLPVADFLLGPRQTARRPEEVAAAVELPVPTDRLGTAFARLTRRRGVDLATLSLCCAADARVVRFGYGAVGPRPFLVTDDSGLLADPGAPEAAREEVLRGLVGQAQPISDVRGSREYRTAMLLVLSRRALAAALAARDAA